MAEVEGAGRLVCLGRPPARTKKVSATKNLTLVGAPWRGGAGTIEAVQVIAETITTSFAEPHVAAAPAALPGATLPGAERLESLHAITKRLVLAGVDGEPIGGQDSNVPLLVRAVADILEDGLIGLVDAGLATQADGPSGWRVVKHAAPALHMGSAQAVASVCSLDQLHSDAERLDAFIRCALNSGELGDALAALFADQPTVEQWFSQAAAVRDAEVVSTLVDVLGALSSLTFRLPMPAGGCEPAAARGGKTSAMSARAADAPADEDREAPGDCSTARVSQHAEAPGGTAEVQGGGAEAEGGGGAEAEGGGSALAPMCAEAEGGALAVQLGAEEADEADLGVLTSQHGSPLGRLAAARSGSGSAAPTRAPDDDDDDDDDDGSDGARVAGAATDSLARHDGVGVGQLLDDRYFEPSARVAARAAGGSFVLKVVIVGAERRREPAAGGGRVFTAYRLEVVSAGAAPCRLLLRRFSAFVRLHKALVCLFPREQLGRRWDARLLVAKAAAALGEGRLAAAVVESRLALLREYMCALMAVPALPASEPMRAFFALGTKTAREGRAADAGGGGDDGGGGDGDADGGAAAAVSRAQQLPVELGDGGGHGGSERPVGRRIKLLVDKPAAPCRSAEQLFADQRGRCAGCSALLGGALSAESSALAAHTRHGDGGGGVGSALFGRRTVSGRGVSAAASAFSSLALRAKGRLALAGLSASGRARVCHYTERLYCARCHSGGEAVVPAKLLHALDSHPYKVCDWASQFLSIVHSQRLLCLSALNPELFRARPHLERLRRLRSEAHELALRVASLPESARIRTQVEAAMADAARAVCRLPAAEQPSEPARMEELLISPELFAIADLLAVAQPSASGQLLPLEAALQVLRAAVARQQPRQRAAEEYLPGVDANVMDSIGAQADAALREAESALRGVSLDYADESDSGLRDPATSRQDDELATDEEVEAVLASALRGDL